MKAAKTAVNPNSKFQIPNSKIKNGGSNLNGLRKKKAPSENQDAQEEETQKKNEIH